ncbi:MAG: FKBP-type peptidyl-prolyl cis-trans isomerase [Bacteroidetes bacterium]|nr:FKBP-type peptidyl-prolyl cis-trans isomerase [Bacteroidota bacterium]
MNNPFSTFLHITLFLFVLLSCNNNKGRKNVSESTLKEPLIDANKKMVKQESDEIDQYVKLQGWKMRTSGSGLRYMIYDTTNKPFAQNGQMAKVKYKISLLDGTVCYSSEKNGFKEFLIGQDHVESGLHEGIRYMKEGEKALFVMPSHLAHGLSGDNDKVPPRSSLVFDIELISLR